MSTEALKGNEEMVDTVIAMAESLMCALDARFARAIEESDFHSAASLLSAAHQLAAGRFERVVGELVDWEAEPPEKEAD